MTVKHTLLKRIIAIFLAMAVFIVTLPMAGLVVGAATSDSYYNRLADANTMDGWKEFFPLESTPNKPLSTENAGGVWTDKSVFTGTEAFPDGINMIDDGKNFLTALSAIAANKEVVGYSTVPTDTVFILDLSNSMSSNSVTQLVSATNQAITKLQQINNNNRVGVVLYSGTSGNRTYDNAVARLLPIDRYTTTRTGNVTVNGNNEEIGIYVEYSGGTVRLARKYGSFGGNNNNLAVSGTGSSIQSESKAHSGATYIQAGLWEAWEMFSAVPDNEIKIGANNWQEGEARMPIVVFMSDGAPTLGTSYYDNVPASTYGFNNQGKSNVGCGNEDNLTVGQGFLVQLTASYIKNQIENKYKVNEEGYAGRSLFYTLGFNINSLQGTARTVATSVLNPDNSTATDTLWNTYNGLGGNATMQVSVGARDSNDGTMNVAIAKNSYATSKSYVDEYFTASGDGLQNAFGNIVEEILLQSRYYPTHLEGGSPDFSGYVEFTDTLGEYMEVKHINGILLGETLFDGHKMASKLADTSSEGLGTPEKPTELGDEFIWSVQTRLGIESLADARALVTAAYRAGQLAYVSDTEWSNYIGWYADAEGKFIAHWDENSSKAAPAGAVYKIKSYGFLGETTGSIKNSDMMYMSVQVRTDIATGAVTVSWKIPAALVPMVTYLIEVDGNSVDTATNVRVQVEDTEVEPIRLVYETGLRSDLNEFNVTRITDEAHIASDGHTRKFWNNYFNIEAPSHDQHITALSEFTPNKENERFYYTFDSAVYKEANNGYELVTKAEGLSESGTYYHRRYIFRAGYDEPVFFYEKMSAESVKAAIENKFKDNFENLEHNTVGAWVVPAGTPARELNMYDRQKNANPTESAHMVFHPYMATQNNMVYVEMNLGNNGLLAVTPATGIKITKTVDIFETGTSDTFKFRITAQTSGTFDSWITKAGETPIGEGTPVTLTNGVYEFEMKKDQTFWLTGLSADTSYVVEEISNNSDYKIKSVHVNGVSTGKAAAGVVTQYLVDDISFVNTAKSDGDLVITKQVIDASGNTVDVNDSVIFTAQVALTKASGAPVSGTFGSVTVPASGIFTIELKEGESVVLRGIPEDTRYTVTETNIPAGFTLNSEKSTLSGIVDVTANDQALIVNNYKPTSTDGAEVNVRISKEISGNRTQWLSGEVYEFVCQRIEDGAPVTMFNSLISYDDSEKTADGNLINDIYTEAGTYNYVIYEKEGNRGGITYDTEMRRFSVEVADSDMDGDLEIVAVNNVTNTTVTPDGSGYLVSANFNNVYAPTGSANVIINVEKRIDGHRKNGFQFALYDGADVANANEILRSTVTDAQGNAYFSITYVPNFATIQGTKYTYWLAEINTGNPNITYDNTVYKVEVTVKDNGDGTITATPVISGIPQGEINPVFTNIFTPSASDYVTLTANKTVSGDRVLNANEFSFVIEALTQGAPMPANSIVKNAANGAVVFDAIEFDTVGTYKYKIYESQENKIGGFLYDSRFYEITVVVTDNGNATLSAAVTRVVKENENDSGRTLADNELISFTNTYDATDAKVTISGTKILTGKTLQDNEFEFDLLPETQGAPMPSQSYANNKKDGSFTFGEITYSKAGTYVYKLIESNLYVSGYTYDKSVYTVTVFVTDNSRGLLSAKVELKKNGLPSTEIVFRNGFTPTPISYNIEADFGGEKVLDGRPIVDGEFEFALINAINGKQIGETVKNKADGTKSVFRFPAVALPEAGIYHFKIVEVLGDEKGVSYDTATFHIRLEVVQNDSGILSIIDKRLVKATVQTEIQSGVPTEVTRYENITSLGSAGIVFKNSYKADPVYVTLEATKLLTGRNLVDGEFKFDLHNTDDTYAWDEDTLILDDTLLSLQNDGTGKVTFMPLSFDTADDYYFVIVEDEKDEKGVTADKNVYKIKIAVTDNHKGDLVASVEVNGEDLQGDMADTVKFTNVYRAESGNIIIKGTKVLSGRDLVEGEFTFNLYDAKANGANFVRGELKETVKNAADGSFVFGAIEVAEAGEYHFFLTEDATDAKEGITYDTKEYHIVVTVTDNLDGTLAIAYNYSVSGSAAENLVFTNHYTAPVPPADDTPVIPAPEIPKTGDNSNIILWIALLFVSGGTVTTLGIYRLKKKES